MSLYPSTLSLPEIQESFREIHRELERLPEQNRDLRGQRFLNASNAASPREFLTLGQGNALYATHEELQNVANAIQETSAFAIRIDTYANRGSASTQGYTLFSASDRNYVTWASNGQDWIYAYGIHSRTQSQLAALAATLGTNDAGYKVNVTDFAHVLQWTGSAWEWGPGEVQGGYIAFFPAAPSGNGWVLVDGTATSYLKSDGTTQSYTPYDVSTMMLPYLRR